MVPAWPCIGDFESIKFFCADWVQLWRLVGWPPEVVALAEWSLGLVGECGVLIWLIGVGVDPRVGEVSYFNVIGDEVSFEAFLEAMGLIFWKGDPNGLWVGTRGDPDEVFEAAFRIGDA